eukprot:CAMPEP_0203882094 /NCGR_PEP_ID=MMETSP0359-20131031/26332_1 /ASSEMBLY_ACC=CAM_ASM_000338 /TAXON_ID=268821 /ORGANISM="Scrippsiella Hangoei, Strain SHTV-5" /LENGTH=447 /DNA_ID=CAMNT_0050802085 /DNA_START=22 /DNA_END=1362 /DNA_ORIENTATION=+
MARRSGLCDIGAVTPFDARVGAVSNSAEAAELCCKVGLLDIAGEGRTLVALESILQGTRILSEKPTVVAGGRSELEECVASLLAEDPGVLAPALTPTDVSGSPGVAGFAAEAVARFSLDFLDGACWVMFRVLSVVNHACASSEEANCCLSVPFDAGAPAQGKVVDLIAVRNIQAGEPLRMPYTCPFAARSQLDALQAAHGFRCTCSTCRAPAPGAVVRGCAGCGARAGEVTLSRCSGCRSVMYCGADCQRRHRKEHKPSCGEGATKLDDADRSFLEAAAQEFDAVMAASDAALCAASQALRARQRFTGESQLEESLVMAGSFLARRVDAAPALVGSQNFAYYARGNFVKQALSRLAMRLRLLGREPRGGCGHLASRACKHLEACLDVALLTLPRFHVEVFSLLCDVKDLGEVVENLLGLAPDLEANGRPDEGTISEEGLEEVSQWCS